MRPQPSHYRLILLNTLANAAGQFWVKLLALIVVPWLFNYLGQERWAVYGLGLTVTFLFTLADPGLKFGYIKIFSELLAKERGADLRRLIAAGFGVYALAYAAGFALVWLGIEPVLDFAGVEAGVRGEARFFFIALLAFLAVSETFSVFQYLLLAQQRMGLANLLLTLGALAHYGGLALTIVRDWGLRGVGVVFIAAALFEAALFVGSLPSALRRAPKGAARPEPTGRLLAYLFQFAWRMKVAVNSETVVTHVDKLFISRCVGFQAAGLYQLGSSLAIVLRDSVRLLVAALLPAAADLAAREGTDRMRAANREAARWFFVLASPCFLFVAASARLVVVAWIGRDIDQAALALGLLAVAFYANTAVAASMQVGAACHLPQMQMRAALLGAGVNVAANAALAVAFGFTGVLAASIGSQALASLYYARLIAHALGDRLGDFLLRTYARPLVAAALPALAILWRSGPSPTASRAEAIAALAALLPAYLAAYVCLLALSGHVGPRDLALLWEKIGRRREKNAAR